LIVLANDLNRAYSWSTRFLRAYGTPTARPCQALIRGYWQLGAIYMRFRSTSRIFASHSRLLRGSQSVRGSQPPRQHRWWNNDPYTGQDYRWGNLLEASVDLPLDFAGKPAYSTNTCSPTRAIRPLRSGVICDRASNRRRKRQRTLKRSP
jgi:hypothetical protein